MKRGTLAWRLYALGVVQLALVTLAVVVLAIRDAPGPPPQDLERQVDVAAVRLTPLLAHPNNLSSELGELRSHGIAGSNLRRAGEAPREQRDPADWPSSTLASSSSAAPG